MGLLSFIKESFLPKKPSPTPKPFDVWALINSRMSQVSEVEITPMLNVFADIYTRFILPKPPVIGNEELEDFLALYIDEVAKGIRYALIDGVSAWVLWKNDRKEIEIKGLTKDSITYDSGWKVVDKLGSMGNIKPSDVVVLQLDPIVSDG